MACVVQPSADAEVKVSVQKSSEGESSYLVFAQNSRPTSGSPSRHPANCESLGQCWRLVGMVTLKFDIG